MTFEEFRRKIEACNRTIDSANEHSIYSAIRQLHGLIELGKNEGHLTNIQHQKITEEIIDMDKSEHEVTAGKERRQIDNRLKTFKFRIRVELTEIIKS